MLERHKWFMRDSETKEIKSYTVGCSEARVCAFCGQYFRPNDTFSIVFIPSVYRGTHKKLSCNLLMHTEELKDLFNSCVDDDDFANKLIALKTPRRKPFSDEELFRLESFKRACVNYGFREEINKPYGVRMKQYRSSMYLDYHIPTGYIHLDYRGKRGLFDRFYEMELVAKIRNKMNEYMGINKKDDFTAEKAINDVYDSVEKSMKNIFN